MQQLIVALLVIGASGFLLARYLPRSVRVDLRARTVHILRRIGWVGLAGWLGRASQSESACGACSACAPQSDGKCQDQPVHFTPTNKGC